MFFDSDAVTVIRHVLLLMLCRNERKRAVMKLDDGSFLTVEALPHDIADGQVIVILSREIDEECEPVFPVEAVACVGSEVLF